MSAVRYFVVDPGAPGIVGCHESLVEAIDDAQVCIAEYRRYACLDGEWSDCVDGISIYRGQEGNELDDLEEANDLIATTKGIQDPETPDHEDASWDFAIELTEAGRQALEGKP